MKWYGIEEGFRRMTQESVERRDNLFLRLGLGEEVEVIFLDVERFPYGYSVVHWVKTVESKGKLFWCGGWKGDVEKSLRCPFCVIRDVMDVSYVKNYVSNVFYIGFFLIGVLERGREIVDFKVLSLYRSLCIEFRRSEVGQRYVAKYGERFPVLGLCMKVGRRMNGLRYLGAVIQNNEFKFLKVKEEKIRRKSLELGERLKESLSFSLEDVQNLYWYRELPGELQKKIEDLYVASLKRKKEEVKKVEWAIFKDEEEEADIREDRRVKEEFEKEEALIADVLLDEKVDEILEEKEIGVIEDEIPF